MSNPTVNGTETTPKPYLRLPLTVDGQLISTPRFLLKSPRTQVIMSSIRSGKTDAMMGRTKFFIGDSEGGTEKYEGNNCNNLYHYFGNSPDTYSKALKANIPSGLYELCTELYRANRMKEFHLLNSRYLESMTEENYRELVQFINSIPFPIFTLDTLTHFMPLVYQSALADYNMDHKEPRSDIRKVDKFGGARFIRQKVEDIRSFIEKNAAPFIIYTGHLKENKAVLEKDEEKVTPVDLALEGQLPLIFTSKTEAVAVFMRTQDGCYLDYRKRGEDALDARSRHLGGRRIKISELHTYEIDDNGEQFLKEKGKTYWERIYPEVKFS